MLKTKIMKGTSESLPVPIISIVLLAFLLILIGSAFTSVFGPKGIYDDWSSPGKTIVGKAAAGITQAGANEMLGKGEKLLNGVSSIIYNGGSMEGLCRQWYGDCGGDSTIWNNRLCYLVSDYNNVQFFDGNCGEKTQKSIDEALSSLDTTYSGKSDANKLATRQNACGLILLDKVNNALCSQKK